MSSVVVEEPYRLGELDFARYFDHALGLLRNVAKPVAIALVLIAFPPQLIFFFFDLTQGFSDALAVDPMDPMVNEEALFELWFWSFLLVMGSGLLIQAVTIYLIGIVSYMVGMQYLDHPVTLGEAARFVLRRYPALLAAAALALMAISAGFMLCIIPGILMTVWFYAYCPVIIFEQAGPVRALSRSRDLIAKGEFLRVLFLMFVLGFISLPLIALSTIVPNAAVEYLLQSMAGAVAQVVSAAVVTVLYFALRCKHESLDLDILANAIDAEVHQEAPAL